MNNSKNQRHSRMVNMKNIHRSKALLGLLVASLLVSSADAYSLKQKLAQQSTAVNLTETGNSNATVPWWNSIKAKLNSHGYNTSHWGEDISTDIGHINELALQEAKERAAKQEMMKHWQDQPHTFGPNQTESEDTLKADATSQTFNEPTIIDGYGKGMKGDQTINMTSTLGPIRSNTASNSLTSIRKNAAKETLSSRGVTNFTSPANSTAAPPPPASSSSNLTVNVTAPPTTPPPAKPVDNHTEPVIVVNTTENKTAAPVAENKTVVPAAKTTVNVTSTTALPIINTKSTVVNTTTTTASANVTAPPATPAPAAPVSNQTTLINATEAKALLTDTLPSNVSNTTATVPAPATTTTPPPTAPSANVTVVANSTDSVTNVTQAKGLAAPAAPKVNATNYTTIDGKPPSVNISIESNDPSLNKETLATSLSTVVKNVTNSSLSESHATATPNLANCKTPNLVEDMLADDRWDAYPDAIQLAEEVPPVLVELNSEEIEAEPDPRAVAAGVKAVNMFEQVKKQLQLAGADLREFGADYARNIETITDAQKNITMDLQVLAQDVAMLGDTLQGFTLTPQGIELDKKAAKHFKVSPSGDVVANSTLGNGTHEIILNPHKNSNDTNVTHNVKSEHAAHKEEEPKQNVSEGNVTVTKDSLAHSISILKSKIANQTHNDTEPKDDVVVALEQLKAAIYASRVAPKIGSSDRVVVNKENIKNITVGGSFGDLEKNSTNNSQPVDLKKVNEDLAAKLKAKEEKEKHLRNKIKNLDADLKHLNTAMEVNNHTAAANSTSKAELSRGPTLKHALSQAQVKSSQRVPLQRLGQTLTQVQVDSTEEAGLGDLEPPLLTAE